MVAGLFFSIFALPWRANLLLVVLAWTLALAVLWIRYSRETSSQVRP
jgi:hypothetical protein